MPHGLQHEHVFVYDAWLPQRFTPQNQDGEVCETQLLPVNEVIERVLKHEFTEDAALVIVDGLCRLRFFGLESLSIHQLVANHLSEVKQRFIAGSPPLI